MTKYPFSPLQVVGVCGLKYTKTYKILKFIYIFFLFAFISLSAEAQPDLETAIPSNYRAAKGTLSISDKHYRLGQQSLRWDWVAGDTLIIDLSPAEEAVVNPQLTRGGTHHFETWVYKESTSTDTFAIKFQNWQGLHQFSFRFNVNYKGWRRLLRNFQTDMQLIYETPNIGSHAAHWNIDKILFVAPLSGSGYVFIDNMKYMSDGHGLESDYAMPDLHSKSIRPFYNSDLHYRIDSLNKLVALVTPSAKELADATLIRQKIVANATVTRPTATQVQNANTEYATYNIQLDAANNVKGRSILTPEQITNVLTVLTNNALTTNDAPSKEKVINLLRLFVDCGFAEGSGLWFAGYQSGGYVSVGFYRALKNAYSLLPTDLRNEIWRWLKWCTDVNLGWDNTEYNGKFNTDNIYTMTHAYLTTLLYSTDDATTVKDMKCLKQFLEKFLTPQKGISEGMKIDGTAFHHNGHYNTYMYAFGLMIDSLMSPFIATSFQVNEQAYNNLRKVAYGQYISSNPSQFANSLSGRIPFSTDIRIRTPTLARIGGGILNTPYDPIAAGMYVRTTNNTSAFPGVQAEPFPTGFWQMNYSPAAIYRRDNWVATMRGSTPTFWGTEIYSGDNVYGRYLAYGALEIMYPKGLTASGMKEEGWDWNKIPGTTSIELPFESLRTTTVYESNNLHFAGGTKFGVPLQTSPSDIILKEFHGDYGMYGLNFQQQPSSATHTTTFVFRKSFFCFDNKIVCVGSNINNNKTSNNTITTLFQGSLLAPSNAIEVDGSGRTDFPFSQTLGNTSAHRLLDSYKTGYYIMSGSTVQVNKKNQTSPDQSGSGATTAADYATAYIDHGKAPVDGKYVYVVLPNTTSAALNDFANKMGTPSTREFDILQQDEHAHIVRENATGVTGYSLFTANTNLTSNEVLKANTVPCVAMLQVKDDTLRINVVNPNINLVNNESTAIPITIKLFGEWLKAANIPAKYASVVATDDDETTLMFSVADGLPAEITLVNFASSVLPLTSLNLIGKTDAGAGRNVLTMEFENNDNADYALEYKSSESADWRIIDTKNISGAATKQSFEFYHSDPLTGENQYRIKCTDIDGTIKYSNIVLLKNLLANDVAVAPNPAKNEFSIILKEKPIKPLLWNLIDGSGRIVKTGSIANTRENVNVRALTPGVYYIRFVNGRYFPVVIIK